MVTREKTQRARELRRAMTPAERLLWQNVRGHRLDGLGIRRQVVIAGFIVDFYCHAARLAIELDGGVHAGQAEYDAARDAALRVLEVNVIRIPNEDVLTRLPDVLTLIKVACRRGIAG